MKRKGVSQVVLLALLVGGGIFLATQTQILGAVGGQQDEISPPGVRIGTAATAKLKAVERSNASIPQVATTVRCYANDVNNGAVSVDNGDQLVDSVTTNTGSRKDMTGFAVGQDVKCIGFDSTHDYGTPKALGEIVTENPSLDIDVYQGVSSSNVAFTFFDENDASATSITVDSGETYTASGLRVSPDTEDVAFNAYMLTFNTSQLDAELANNGIQMPNAESASVPDKLDGDFQYAYKVFDAGDLLEGEEPNLNGFERLKSGQINIKAASGKNPSGDLEICVEDLGLYEAAGGATKQAVETAGGRDAGVGQACTTVTIN